MAPALGFAWRLAALGGLAVGLALSPMLGGAARGPELAVAAAVVAALLAATAPRGRAAKRARGARLARPGGRRGARRRPRDRRRCGSPRSTPARCASPRAAGSRSRASSTAVPRRARRHGPGPGRDARRAAAGRGARARRRPRHRRRGLRRRRACGRRRSSSAAISSGSGSPGCSRRARDRAPRSALATGLTGRPRPGPRAGPGRALARARPTASAALLRGFVLGQDDRIDAGHRRRVQALGTRAPARRLGPERRPAGDPGRGAARRRSASACARGWLCILGLIGLYVLVTGAGPSIQRAGLMGAAGVVAALAGRPSSRWYALGLAAAATLAIDPRAAGDVGWQLSFAAVARDPALDRAPAPGARRARARPRPAGAGRGGGDDDRGDASRPRR